MALELISFSEDKVQSFSNELIKAKSTIKYCQTCFFLSLSDHCNICMDNHRNSSTLCVVSDPKDVIAIEQSKSFKGKYHVLGGLISPLDGVYPEMLRVKELIARIRSGVQDLILALSPTVEGDTTAMYIQERCKADTLSIYKLAQGIPIGADLAYLDEVTIDKAFQGMIKL